MTKPSIFFRLINFALAIGCCSLVWGCCHKSHVRVQSDYLGRHSLASYFVGTPDPLLDAPPLGQRLIISWSFPTDYLQYQDLHLRATLRYRNREQTVQHFSLQGHLKGILVYALTGEEYFEKKGILTYQIEVIAQGKVLETVQHQLWVNLITLNTESGVEPSKESVAEEADVEKMESAD